MDVRAKTPLRGLLALVVLAACPAHADPDGAAIAGMVSHELARGLACPSTRNAYECVMAHEAREAEAHGVRLSGSDDRTCFSVGSRDFCFPRVAGLRYVFLGRAHGHLEILEIADEGFQALLVDETTGTTTRIDNRPVYSPDGSTFATVSFDIDAGLLPNRVVVLESASKRIVHRVDGFPRAVGPVAIRWTDEGRLAVLSIRDDGDKPVRKYGSIWRDRDGSWRDDMN